MRIKRMNFKDRSLLLALVGPALLSPAALAQDANEEAENTSKSRSLLMQSITVTANKREESLNDVGISATAFTGETLSQLGLTNTSDLARITPGLSINVANPSVSTLSIRGVSQNDFADHMEAPIAMYHDEGYIGSSGGVSVPSFDIERIEVLRGPQGTLFGRNATGGLIHMVSAAPTEEKEGYFQASYGRFDTQNLEGAISGPLSENVLARLSITKNRSDGPFKNTLNESGQIGNVDNWGVRGQLLFNFGENTELRFLGKYFNDDQSGPAFPLKVTQPNADNLGLEVGNNEIGSFPNIVLGGTITAPCAGCNILGHSDTDGDVWTQQTNVPGYYKRDVYGAQIKLSHQMGSTTFTSISDYLKIEKDTFYDVDMSPQHFFTYGAYQDYDQFSQELRLNGSNGNLQWVAGVYYLDMNGFYTQPLDLDFGVYVGNDLCVGLDCTFEEDATIPVHFEPQYTLDVQSAAIFAQGEYAISSDVSATIGLRYTYDDKEFDYHWSDSTPFVSVLDYNDSVTFENVAIKGQLDWRPIEETLLYTSYTRGHKGGNWAAPAFPPIVTDVLPHDEEVLTSYEAGMKTTLFNKLANFNLSAYLYDYKDYQAFSLQGLSQSVFNKDAEILGAEAEIITSPVDGLDLAMTAVYMDSTVKDIVLPSGRTVDRELPNTPSLQATALVRYGWDMFGGEVALQASGKYMGDHYVSVLNEPAHYQDAYTTVGLRASYRPSEQNLELSIYGENVTDEEYTVWSNDVSALSLGNNTIGARSTYGIRIRYDF